MPGIEDALKGAGFSGSSKRKCATCGKEFVANDPKHRNCYDCFRKGGVVAVRSQGKGNEPGFPQGYPGYFDTDGVLKDEYVTTLAEEIARNLGERQMTMHQLRAFYTHVKRQQEALKSGRPFREVRLEIRKLKLFASERASKKKIPEYFEQFISRNVDKINDDKSFLNGFVEHFQAVVAYCAGTLEREKGERR